MNAVKDQVTKLVEFELAAANEKHPPFHSAHEGYALILEEVEEALAEIQSVQDHIEKLWVRIKDNNATAAQAQLTKDAAERLACEAIQVAAMAQKYLDMKSMTAIEPARHDTSPYSKQDLTRAIRYMKNQRIVHQTALEGELNATRKEMHMDELNACACALYALEGMMGDGQNL